MFPIIIIIWTQEGEIAGDQSELDNQELDAPRIWNHVDLNCYLSRVTRGVRHPIVTVTDSCCIDFKLCEANNLSLGGE
jgi:hypothetical protein